MKHVSEAEFLKALDDYEAKYTRYNNILYDVPGTDIKYSLLELCIGLCSSDERLEKGAKLCFPDVIVKEEKKILNRRIDLIIDSLNKRKEEINQKNYGENGK